MLDSLRSTLNAFIPAKAIPVRKAVRRTRTVMPLPFRDDGVSQDWQATLYGEYYARNAEVYAAVRLRAESVARPPLVTYVRGRSGQGEASAKGAGDHTATGRPSGMGARAGLVPAGPDHPVQRLLASVNPWWSTAGLLAATETYLCLWGAAFWRLERGPGGGPVSAIWPLRPDRVRVVRDPGRYVAGFVYAPPSEPGREIPLLPEEVVWFRYFNPLEEMAGLSPMAPARLTADMSMDALRFNREFFKNGARPQDLVFRTHSPLEEAELEEFTVRLAERYSGPGREQRPIVTSDDWEVERLGLDKREMEWLSGLRWGLETAARVYGVPLPLLEDFSHATLNNMREARRLFWEKTVVPELVMLQGVLNDALLPRLGPAARDVTVAFDLGAIEPLSESEAERTQRQVELVRTGILTVNEARRERGLPDVPWGNERPSP